MPRAVWPLWYIAETVLALCLGASLAAGEPDAPQPMRYLVALDFKSDFDGGKFGKQVGRMFRYKATKRKLFSVDVEIDWEEKAELMTRPALDADPVAVAKQAQEAYGCDVLVWGEVEQPETPGPKVVKQHKGYKTTERSDQGLRLILNVRAIDLRRDPTRLAVRETYDLKINYEATAKVDEVLKALTGVPTPADVAAAHVSNRMQPFGPNLCPRGDLEVMPRGKEVVGDLDLVLPEWHWPMKTGIVLTGDKGTSFLRYTLSKNVAATTGLFCYTPYIKIKPETYYQVSFRVKTQKPKVIMFVKGYRDMEVKGYEGVKTLRQEVFKHQKRFYGKQGEWGTLASKPFLPRSAKPQHMPQCIRVQLYAYWPPGTVSFDDVVVRECREPTAKPEATPAAKPEPKPETKPERLQP